MTTAEYEEIERAAARWASAVKKAAACRAKLERLGVDGIELGADGNIKWWRTFRTEAGA